MNIIEEEYKLDAPAYTANNAEEYEMLEVRSDNLTITNDPVFRMSLKDTSTYTNLNKGYLEVKFKIVKASDGSDYTGDAKITLANSIGCLFSRVQARLQNTIVETRDEAHLCNHLKNLVEYSEDYSRSSATNELYYKNTGTSFGSDNTEFITTANEGFTSRNAFYNDGFAKSLERTKNSAVITCILPLPHLLGIATVDRVMSGNTFDLELTRSNASDHLFRASGVADGKVSFERMSLWLPRIRPTPELDMSLKSQMVNGVVSDYKFLDYNAYRTQPLSTSAGSNTQRITTQSEKILHVFVALRRGSRTQEFPVNLTRDEVNEIEVRLNGKSYPSRAYQSMDTSEGKSRAYLELLRQMSRSADYSAGIQLSIEDYAKQTILGFDLTSQDENWSKCASTLEVVSNLKTSTNSEARQFDVVVVSERNVNVSYTGSQAVVSVL